MSFEDEARAYLREKNIEYEIYGGMYTYHVRIKDTHKKFYLGVVLPELRLIGTKYKLLNTGTTFYATNIYVRFYARH